MPLNLNIVNNYTIPCPVSFSFYIGSRGVCLAISNMFQLTILLCYYFLMKNIDSSLIAPCGMNCSLCLGYQREKNHCKGCRNEKEIMYKTNDSAYCVIKKCEFFNKIKTEIFDPVAEEIDKIVNGLIIPIVHNFILQMKFCQSRILLHILFLILSQHLHI